ncbi:helix-turn-helix domain-containing protein [Mycobacterium tuberculosis]|uniref:helix-turn-helix domain-containing protein n=1 Tax=Mycobacterium tuberculosis TaxID=1773 RepID=UPI00272C0F08|nr:flagellar basal body P-ring protein FlgI [Mycobacterium tuberculosis]
MAGDQTTQMPYTTQTLSNYLQQTGISLPPELASRLQLRNVAAVLVTAQLPAFARPGQSMDVTVSSLGTRAPCVRHSDRHTAARRRRSGLRPGPRQPDRGWRWRRGRRQPRARSGDQTTQMPYTTQTLSNYLQQTGISLPPELASRHPVSGAKVVVFDDEATWSASDVSDANGKFSIKHESCKSCFVEITPRQKGELAAALIEEVNGDANRRFLIQLHRGFTVRGCVVAKDGRPLKDIVVKISSAEAGGRFSGKNPWIRSAAQKLLCSTMRQLGQLLMCLTQMASFLSNMPSSSLALPLSRRSVQKSNLSRPSTRSTERRSPPLKAQVTTLERRIVTLSRAKAPAAADADQAPVSTVRFSAKGLRTHRARLGLSAVDFGRLLGVTAQTIYNWEQEASRPRAEQLARIAALAQVRAEVEPLKAVNAQHRKTISAHRRIDMGLRDFGEMQPHPPLIVHRDAALSDGDAGPMLARRRPIPRAGMVQGRSEPAAPV